MPFEYLKVLRVPHEIAIYMDDDGGNERLPFDKDMTAVGPEYGSIDALYDGRPERGAGVVLAFEDEEVIEVTYPRNRNVLKENRVAEKKVKKRLCSKSGLTSRLRIAR